MGRSMKITSTDFSACLPEKANSDSIYIFLVNSFVALQSSIMYNVGLPAYLLKNISNSCNFSSPLYTGFTNIKFFVLVF